MRIESSSSLIHTERAELRAAIRAGAFGCHTAGQCPEYTHSNLAVL